MSKAALDHFTKTMAHSLQAEGVRVNSINPATVRPGQNGKRRMDADIFDAENFWHRSMLDARLNLIEASKNLDAEMRNGIHRIHRHRKDLDASF